MKWISVLPVAWENFVSKQKMVHDIIHEPYLISPDPEFFSGVYDDFWAIILQLSRTLNSL